MHWLRGAGSSARGAATTLPSLRKKISNSWSAVQDTYFSTKDVFERHRVVFTVGTSLASLATAWAGYSLRYVHQSKVEQRLDSIEQAMRGAHIIDGSDIKKMVSPGNTSTTYLIATAGTSLVIGYGLGWRGGKWYATRKFRKEQLRSMGMNKIQKWQFLKRPFLLPSRMVTETGGKNVSGALRNGSVALDSKQEVKISFSYGFGSHQALDQLLFRCCWWLFPKVGVIGLKLQDYLAVEAIFSATDTVCALQRSSQ